MARETLDKILKYQNGGKPKPKKRIIFAEAPISTEVVVTPTKKGITKGVFDQDQMRIGRAELYDEAVKIKNKFNLTGFRSGEDFNEFADEVIDVINKDQDYNELTRYLKDNFNIDVSNETGLKKAYSKATGFTGINKYGIDNFKFSERKFREEDFIDEAKAIARASKQVDNIPTEIVPLYGYEDFNKVKEKYTKDYLNDADVVLLGHHSTDKIGGIDTKDWDSFLSSNMDKENICYGGICHGGSMAEVFNNIPNFTGTINDPWIGIPRFNDYKGKGSFEELFFGNQISDRDMEDGEVKVVKPKYGVDYNNYTLNPKIELKRDEIGRPVMTTTLIDDLIQRVVVPDVTPLPTNIDPIKRQNGGMKNTKYPIKPKFSYQGGGYAELQGDAGSLLREIMKGTSLSGMFDKQTGSYTPVTGADYLKEKGYSKPYPKKDAFGNVTMYVRDANGNEIDAKAANAEFEAYNKNQAAQFNQNQEEFNKMLPLTQNLAGLFDLQQREQDEIANKKLRVQDFPTSYSSYAPVGFAEEGGGVSMEKSSYPSLSALYKGLPKGMSKKHKEMVASSALKEAVGMSLNNFKQKMGYRNDSPFKNEPSQNIHSNVISMDNVDKTLLAIPDVGIPKMLTPNSGTHIFPGASIVTEIPKAQDGTRIENVVIPTDDFSNNFEKVKQAYPFLQDVIQSANPKLKDAKGNLNNSEYTKAFLSKNVLSKLFGDSFRKGSIESIKKELTDPNTSYDRKMEIIGLLDRASYLIDRANENRIFTNGGYQKNKNMKKIESYLQGGSVIRKDLIANEDSKANSYVNLPQLIPIQTEIKETVFLLPTGDLVDTNARKRHSKMSENEVTDIVPEDSYVFSQFGDAKIYRDDASQIVMQIKTEPYNTKKTAKMPEVKTLGDVMTKNVMSPADLTRVVSNMFKTVDLDDPFTVQTNEANKFNRNAYLHAIMGLAEYDKARKGIENDYQTQMQDQGPAMVAKQGGTVKMNYKVPKAFDPLSLISLVPSLIGVINDFSDKKRLKQNTALNAADIRDYEQKAYANNDASTVISGLGTILQDTKVTPVINDTSYLDDINTNNMAYLDTASRRLTADAFNNRLDTSSMTPQQAMLFAERDNANRYESLAKSTVDLARTRAASFEKYRLLKGEADNANNASRVGAENATRAGNNSRLGILSGIISGGLENKTNIAANVLDANMANRGNYASNISQINSNTARNLQSAANVGLQMYSSEQAKKAAEAEKRGRKAIEYKEECTAQGYNWICAPDGICYCDN